MTAVVVFQRAPRRGKVLARAGLSALWLSALFIGIHAEPLDAAPPPSSTPSTERAAEGGNAAPGARRGLEPLDRAVAPEANPANPANHGPLEGLQGAATALASRDFALALAMTDALEPPEPGTETWFRVGALRGRAFREVGKPRQAVETLEPLWKHDRTHRYFPVDRLGFELARSRLDWARSGELDPKEADRQLKLALSELAKVQRIDQVRNYAEAEVLQAQALLEVEGTSNKAKRVAALRAAKAAKGILEDYPHHPQVGEFWLEQALAMARAGRTRDAAEQLREIAIARAGEPEADRAWLELETLAENNRRISARPFSIAEELRRAEAARGNRRLELSREILDRLLASDELPSFLRDDARRSRAWTAYKQLDFGQCADDLVPLYEATGSYALRDDVAKCLERAERYEEALDIWREAAKTRRRGLKAHALWEATELAVRGGLYQRAAEFLDAYEKVSKGHPSSRAWYHAWLPYRLGDFETAVEAFEEAARYRSNRTRANYFRGKLLVAAKDPEKRKTGAALLKAIATNDPWDYYGLMARQRMLDAGVEPPALPELDPMEDEALPPPRAQTEELLAEMDQQFGDAWPPVRRAKQLYQAGYLEETRREVRVAVEAFLTMGRKSGGPRSEAIYKGLGWKAEWRHPRVAPTRAGRKMLYRRSEREELRVGLRRLARAVEEPYRYIKLTEFTEAPYKSRWHPRAYRAAVEREARLRGIDPIHMWSLMYTESRFRRFVVSPVGARGALQIMPSTARQLAERLGEFIGEGRFDNDLLFDIDHNAHLAGYYVSELLSKFHGQAPMAYASYNGGPYNVQRWLTAKAKSPSPLELDTFIEEIPFSETYRYTRRVMEVSAAYAVLYRGDVPRWGNAVDPVVEDNINF